MKYLLHLLVLLCLTACNPTEKPDPSAAPDVAADLTTDLRWSPEKTQSYVDSRPLPLGANYINRAAINQLEMWQAATFTPEQIDEELGWAKAIGMNSMRVYLHNLVWEEEGDAYLKRIAQYLDIAEKHEISTTFVLWDAVWNPVASLGIQPDPRSRVHNSGWVQSPRSQQLMNGDRYFPTAKKYVQAILRHFKDDPRIYAWDLYNEPDNNNFGKFPNEPKNKLDFSYALMVKTFAWAREVNPSQPLTAGVWRNFSEDLKPPTGRFNDFQLAHSDIISFHFYDNPERIDYILPYLETLDRPLLYTEYVARGTGNTFLSVLPIWAEHQVGAYNWGLVEGKTNTIYPWVSWDSTFTAEPHLWHHDVFRSDGTPYDAQETKLIKETGKGYSRTAETDDR
jgi:hypothetical protein